MQRKNNSTDHIMLTTKDTNKTMIDPMVTTRIGTMTTMENDHHGQNEAHIKKNALAVDQTHLIAPPPKHEASQNRDWKK
jgi:hypothetical protein